MRAAYAATRERTEVVLGTPLDVSSACPASQFLGTETSQLRQGVQRLAARRRVLEVGPRIESRERALRADCWTGQEPFRLRFG